MNHDTNTTHEAGSPIAGLFDADMERIAASFVTAASSNTRRAYRGGWERWQTWASQRGAEAMPADATAVAAYLTERAETGSAPATVRLDRASIAAFHRAAGAHDPTAHETVRHVMRCIARAHHDRGRGQVQGVDWDGADRAAELAENDGSAAGLRDGALIRVGSDAILRVSELAALNAADLIVQPDGTGTVTVWQSKTDQCGRGHVRFVGAPTVAAPALPADGQNPRRRRAVPPHQQSRCCRCTAWRAVHPPDHHASRGRCRDRGPGVRSLATGRLGPVPGSGRGRSG